MISWGGSSCVLQLGPSAPAPVPGSVVVAVSVVVVVVFVVVVLVVFVSQLDELRVLVDRQDLEHLFVVEAFVPLAGYGIVIATHGSPRLFAPILRARADG